MNRMGNVYSEQSRNPLQDSIEDFTLCYNEYFTAFKTVSDLKEELARPDVNFVCKKQLNSLKSQVSSAGMKEVLGHTRFRRIKTNINEKSFFEDSKPETD